MKKVTSNDGTTIAFDVTGNGPALILTGGGFQYRSIGSKNWEFAELLGKYFTTFHYDRRGRGGSTDTQPYAIEREIEDIDAIITVAGGSAFLFGHSSGALLALDAAKYLNGKILKLALYEPAFVANEKRPALPDNLIGHLKKLIDSGRSDAAVEYFMTKVINLPAKVISDLKRTPSWPEVIAVAPTLIYDATLMFEVSGKDKQQLSKRWENVTIPTLVIDGDSSWQWTRSAAETIFEILANARHQTLKRQQHEPAPAVLAPVLELFFN